ncbi:transporter substrate-binding domain-containing protein [Azoarcus taiwanensis]|nr:transporter substrate-binding domain-containing protein [Azoarcus taiwanensis]
MLQLRHLSLGLLHWLAVLIVMSAVSLPASATDGEIDRPVVTIGVVAENEPYSWIDETGQLAGFSIDVLERVAELANIRFSYRIGNWPEIYRAFLDGELDAIDEISYREDRAQRMLFTEPYHYRRTVIMHDGNRPLPVLDGLEGLHPYRVGVVRDIFYKDELVSRGQSVIEYDSLHTLIRALAFGWVDAVIGPEVTLAFLAQQAGFNHLAIAGRFALDRYELEDFRIAVLADRPDLHSRLDAAVSALPEADMRDMLMRWQEFGGRAPLRQAGGFRLGDQSAAYVRRLGPVRVGLMRDYAPFSFVDGGSLQGLSVDVLSRIQDLTGLQVITVTDRWPVLMEMFRRGEIDIVANMSANEERLEYTRFTEPYYLIPNVVFTRDPALEYLDSDSLAGLRIAIGSGIYYEPWVRQRFGDAVLGFSSQRAMFEALAEGSVDVVLAALPNGNHWVRELRLADVRIAGEFSHDGSAGEDLRFGVRPALEPLVAIMNAALEGVSPTERRTIENRWMGASASPPASSDGRVSLGAEARAFLSSRGETLRVCIDPEWMPIEGFDANGRHVGVSADYLEHFARRFAVEFEVVRTVSWSESVEAILAGRCDMLPMAMSTPERRKVLDFTTPYYIVPNVLLGRIETPFVDGLAEFDERRVGVVRGYAFAELLADRHPRVNFVDVATEVEGLRALRRGEIHAFVSTLATASHYMQELGLADLKVIARVPGDWTLSIATRKDEPLLLEIASAFIDSIGDDERREIDARWRALRLAEPSVDYTWLWRGLAAAVLAFALLFAWNRKLGQLNRQLAEANERLAAVSVTDALTGIGNRKFFDQEYERMYRWCQRHGLGFAVAMIDIDHFKSVNDTYGHEAGDACLRALALCLQTHGRRETDRLARFGGEEFVMFGTWDDAGELQQRFARIREAVEALPGTGALPVSAMTVSVGLAYGIAQADKTAGEFIARADKALYEAKRAGRNRIVAVTMD